MKKKLLALALVACLSATGGYAAGSGTAINVYYDAVKKIMINNQDKTPADVKPFVYNGTTYVPLRYISEQLGQSVYYDAPTQIIYIGAHPKILSVEKRDLFTIPFASVFQAYVYRLNNSTLPVGNVDLDVGFDYPEGYKMNYMYLDGSKAPAYEEKTSGLSTRVDVGDTEYTFLINKEYDMLSGTVGFDGKLNKNIPDCTVNILVDDVIRQQIKLTSKNAKGVINTALTDGKVLKVQLLVDGYTREHNSEMIPFINLTDMNLEKYSYK